MKYKNRNKAPLPVPGEMLRYRIRDSAGAPSRARKQTQRNPAAAAVAPVLSALTARVSFFFTSLLYRMSSPGETLERAAGPPLPRGKNGRNCELSAIFPSGWKFRDYRWERRETARLLYPAICSFETNHRVFMYNATDGYTVSLFSLCIIVKSHRPLKNHFLSRFYIQFLPYLGPI